MSFDVTADAYQRFMGRYSRPLAEQFVDLVAVRRGDRVLDVGCGPGILTAPLVERCGAERVGAVDPSAPFIAAVRDSFPGVDVHEATAEALPFDDDTFDAALAQLVVHFMSDPVAGLREMGRVTKPGGVVSASVWDFAGGRRRCRCSGRPPRRSTRPRPARPTGPGRVRVRSSRSPATPACATSGRRR